MDTAWKNTQSRQTRILSYIKGGGEEKDLIERLHKVKGQSIDRISEEFKKTPMLHDFQRINLWDYRKGDAVSLIRDITDTLIGKVPVKVPKVKIPAKVISQKSRLGNIYSRSKPVRFSIKEVVFLEVAKRQKRSNKKIVEGFNEIFKARSKSSILTKKHRI